MKKILTKDLTLYFNKRYPYINRQKSYKKNLVTIGIGGNIGDVLKRFKHLFLMFKNNSRFTIVQTSPILKNPPFGYLDQDNFLNAIMILKTNLSSKSSLKAFQRYEIRFKRARSFKDAPRTLDIDIIFFNNQKIKTKELIVPHNDYKNRNSVIIPLNYVNPSSTS